MYQIIIMWDDCSSKTETTANFPSALACAAIYVEDPTCISVEIYDWNKHKLIMDWDR